MKTRSNRNFGLVSGLTYKKKSKKWVSPTKLRNALLNDHLIDYLVLKKDVNTEPDRDDFLFYLFEQGDKFEETVIKYIETNIHPVINLYGDFRKTTNVKLLMEKGVPFISSVPLKNKYIAVRGVADLLVRSDYINKLVPDTYSEEQMYIQAPNLKTEKPYHYIVIEIKLSTIHINSKKEVIESSNIQYISQSYIYARALYHLQGYMAPCYILGRKYVLKSQNKSNYINNSLSLMGKVVITENVIKKTNDAIKWVRKLDRNINLEKIGIYPNMCVTGTLFNEKLKYAQKINELTMITSVGNKEREIAIKNGITNWMDIKCSASIMGITNPIREKYIDAIININRNSDLLYTPNKIEIFKNKTKNVYIDFELIQDIFCDFDKFPISTSSPYIFMIGIIYDNKYTSIKMEKLSPQDELELLQKFVTFLNSLPQDTTIWYYSAEKSFWTSALQRHTNFTPHLIHQWIDMNTVLKENAFAVKGSFNYSLKSILRALASHNLVNFSLDTDCQDGMSASLTAWKYYTSDKKDISIMNDIEKYNYYDCYAMQLILELLK